ncbi:YDG domain-containing protein [Rufibacter aurantiacus]|uniref:YDG domain-containing protein n=1 Tax=Rufibacter aurantiacus TaxID=2817374 RepID=UPI001B31586B|nr:YDG domain-containing protein [Rufibacter aurantiacus]
MKKLYLFGSFKSLGKLLLVMLVMAVLSVFNSIEVKAQIKVTTLATGGANLSADLALNATGGGAFTGLGDIVVSETGKADFLRGGNGTNFVVNAPAGWIFDTTPNSITVVVDRSQGPSNFTVSLGTVTTTAITVAVSAPSQDNKVDFFTISGIKVKAEKGSPLSTGSNITGTFSNRAAVVSTTPTALTLGTLSQIAGRALKLVFQTQPSSEIYGMGVGTPVVRVQDQFNNFTTNNLGTSLIVTASVTSGDGSVINNTQDIGTSSGNGSAVFSNLQTTTVGTKRITVSAPNLASAVSDQFTISQKTLSVLGVNKVYNGDNNASATLVGVVNGDDVTLTGTFSFVDKNVGNEKIVNVIGLGLSGTKSGNYILDGSSAITANITAKELTISGLSAVSRVYDGTRSASLSGAPVLNGVFNQEVSLNPNAVGIASFDTKNFGTGKAVTVTGFTLIGNGVSNYSLTQPTLRADVTQRTLIVTASGQDKIYNGDVAATVVLTTDKIQGDVVNVANSYVATFESKNVIEPKSIIDVSGISISGADAFNYTLASSSASTFAKIIPRTLTIENAVANNKIVDGNFAATITGELVGVLLGDEVTLNGTGLFASKEVGDDIQVVSTSTLNGKDANNYSLVQPTGLMADITPKNDPLPVSLISFSGKQKSSSIDLSWSTAAEKDNDYFQIERSQDGKTFIGVGKVKGNGNSNVLRNYNFSDASAQAGVNYYRLKQVDFDGKFEYSKVIAVKADAKSGVQASLEVYPNPTVGKVYVTSSQVSGAATVTVFHSNGRVVLQQNVQVEVGQPLTLDLSNYSPGVYFLQVQTANGKMTSRVVKQ